LYHATTGLQRLLNEGFKTREQLGGAHALGGGPENAISFALDRRVTRSIAVGLNTLRRAARWELGIGDLILQAQYTAPAGLRALLETIRMKPEAIARLDQGLIFVHATGFGGGSPSGYFGSEHLTAVQWEQIAHLIEDVEEHYADPRSQKPYLVEGWAPIGAVIDVKPDARAIYKQHNENFAEAYKTLLAHAEGAKELYNPVFWLTSMEGLAQKDEDDIGVVRCRINADWICADWKSAEQAGLEPETQLRGGTGAYDWADSCDSYLGRSVKARSGGDEPPGWYSAPSTVPGVKWDPPDPSNTVAYRGALTEIRVYDPSLIVDLSEYETFDDVREETADRFDRKGIVVKDPYAHSYFRSEMPRLR
jgi:hypothetical protein